MEISLQQPESIFLPEDYYTPNNVLNFMAEYHNNTIPNPADYSERIWGGMRCIFDCQCDGDVILIESIRSVFRGKGFGSAGLKWLCRLADILELAVYPFGSTKPRLSKEQLIAWYRRHGFTGNGRMTRFPSLNTEAIPCQLPESSPLLSHLDT